MRDWRVDWPGVPISVWAFVCVLIFGIALTLVQASLSARSFTFVALLILAWPYLLLRGNRAIWLLTVAIYLVNIPWIIFGSVNWEHVLLTVLGLLLLLLPTTRDYFDRPTGSN